MTSETTSGTGPLRDRGHLLTEQRHPGSTALDRLGTAELLRLMNAEDRRAVDAVAAALPDVERASEVVTRALRRGGRLIYVGAGTSGRLGVLDAAECPPTFSTPPSLVRGILAGGPEAMMRSREGAEDDAERGEVDLRAERPDARDAVVGIAAGGTTPYVAGALGEARRSGCATVLVTCVPNAPLAELADVTVAVLTGPEILTGSTRLKAGTATKLVLNMLSTSAMVGLGKVYGNLMVDLQVTAAKLDDRGRRILRDLLRVSYEEAGALLRESGGSVKTALVMGRRNVSREEAERLLAAHGGFIRDLLA